MPAPRSPEFRRRAVELARLREKPIAQIARDLGIAESCLRRWMKQDDIDAGRAEGLSTDERAELVRLRGTLTTSSRRPHRPDPWNPATTRTDTKPSVTPDPRIHRTRRSRIRCATHPTELCKIRAR